MEKKRCPGEALVVRRLQGHMGGGQGEENAQAEERTCPGKENAQARAFAWSVNLSALHGLLCIGIVGRGCQNRK